jgi:hypothetical protein
MELAVRMGRNLQRKEPWNLRADLDKNPNNGWYGLKIGFRADSECIFHL